MELPIVAPVQRTLSTKSGAIAIGAILLLALIIEIKTGALTGFLSRTLGPLPVIGPAFRRKAA
jgi:hypothetical protein